MHAAVGDGGRYTCVVSNIAGEERKNFDLDILGKDNRDDWKQHFTDKHLDASNLVF